MKLRELIVMEDGEAAVATASSDIATVSYPLLVRGRNNKEKRKNARAAVGQKYVPGPKGIGQGVFEGVLNEVEPGRPADDKVTKGLQQLATAGVKLQDLPAFTKDGTNIAKVAESDRIFVVVNVSGVNVPYYISTGEGGKASVPTGKWYPFFGLGSSGWLNKGSEQSINKFYGSDMLKTYANLLNLRLGNLQGETLPVMKKTARDVINKDMLNPQNHFTTNEEAVIFKKRINSILQKIGSEPFYATQAAEAFEVEEAHVLNHDNVIYRLDRDNPMSDTEVAVLGGAGRYSLKALRDKARREAAELAQDLGIEHGGAFRRSAENIKQLTNTINTIVAAYNELARLRRKGGRGSRGITDEDANFIRECIRVVEQATQNYRLMEARAVEPDPQGYAKDSIANPKYTVVVNTPGDLDWYKIGMYWHDKVVDPHEFGQDDSDTVMVAQGPEEYKEMMAKIKRMGLTYKEIGGTNDQPEIHSKTY